MCFEGKVTSPPCTVSRPRLKLLPYRPLPLITIGYQVNIKLLCTHGFVGYFKQKPEMSTRILNRVREYNNNNNKN